MQAISEQYQSIVMSQVLAEAWEITSAGQKQTMEGQLGSFNFRFHEEH